MERERCVWNRESRWTRSFIAHAAAAAAAVAWPWRRKAFFPCLQIEKGPGFTQATDVMAFRRH